MIIKNYIVTDMKEAIIRAKYELGSEAVIISQRTIKIGKWYNPFKKERLEVTVALEEKNIIKSRATKEFPVREIPIKEIPLKNITVNDTKPVNANDSLREAIESEPIYSKASNKVKDQLVNYCKLHSKEDHNLTSEENKDFLRIALKDNCFEKKLDLGKINVMIGPTGVGKTTTIAKIASREYLLNNKKVGLITMDTYRIGAVEQLKTYANILGLPFEIVNDPSDMKKKIDKLSYCDIILIDTLGTSPKNQDKLDDINEYIQAIDKNINTYLVLSISTDSDTTLSILDKYKQLDYDALILTKLDEVSNLTNFWCIIENNSYPIQFFCNGQDVPDDIQNANLDNLFDYFEENYIYDRSSK